MKTVSTPQGEVALIEPTAELFMTIRSFLPFGLVGYSSPQREADFALVMQCGEHELYCVKQQPVDCDEQQGLVSYQANSILIAHSLVGYLAHDFSGLFMPCAYTMRKKESGRIESGVAYFGYPSLEGRERKEYSDEGAYDDQFGHGFTTMMISFIRAMQQSSRDTKITLAPTIGLEVRRRLQLGSLGFGFMLVGRHIVCLKTVISKQDPTWTILRSTGVAEVYHLPSIPLAIREDELHTAKPGAKNDE